MALKALSLGILLGYGSALHALPGAGVVTAGNATITNNGAGNLTITQTTPNAALNWQSFNIDATESVRFVQPDSSAVALNRVIGSDPSRILGSLTANGQVFLVNPNGVLFGKDASVNVGGLVASALNLSDQDFMAGRYRFAGPGTGDVRNLGTISTPSGGYVALLGNRVANEGTIHAPLGTVALAAGGAVTLDVTGNGLVHMTLDAATANALASNGGLLQADGGQVWISAAARDALLNTVVNNTGIVQANSLALRNGRIVLDGGDSGVVGISGELRAQGTATTSTGGTIVASGDKVLIADGARLDATGTAGGGAIYVGGGWQGKDDSIRQAHAVYVAQGATLDASAKQTGDGGTVVVWSDVHDPQSSTRVYGALSARGGLDGGNGGRIETSGHWLDVAGIRANASAPRGKAGQWLLDPEDMVVGSVLPTDAACAPGPFPACLVFTSGAGTPNVLNTDIEFQLNLGTGVILQTAPTGVGNGDISITASINKTGGGPAGLMLNAAGSIVMSPGTTIGASSGTLDVFFNGNGVVLNAGSNISSNGGNVGIGAGGSISFNGASNIATNGGNVALIAGGNISVGGPVSFTDSADVNAAGSISVAAGGSLTTSKVGGYLALASTNFNNAAGAGAVNTTGGSGARWIIYTSDPSGNAFGGLVSGNQAIWGQSVASLPPGSVAAGNRYVFATPGVITVTTTSPPAKPYGQTISVADNVSYSGAPLNSAASYGNVYQDLLLTDVLSTLPTVSSAGTPATASVAGSPYPVIAAGGVANAGFSINYVNSGILVVDQAVLSITALADSRIYNGQTYAGGNGVTYAGFLDGDNATVLGGSLVFGGTSQGAVNAGQYSIIPSGLTSNNYSIRYFPATLTIRPKEVTVAGLLADSKEFDGNDSATMRNWGVATTGVGNETLVLNHGDARFSDALVGNGKTVTVDGYSLANGTNGGLASNYVLTSTRASTTADIQVAGRAQTVKTVQSAFNGLTGSSSVDRWRDNFDRDGNQADVTLAGFVDGAAAVNGTAAANNSSARSMGNAGGSGSGAARLLASAAGSLGAGSSASANLGGSASTQANAQAGASQGTSRLSTTGLSSRPAPGKASAPAARPPLPENVFLRGSAIASAVGATSSGDVIVAAVSSSGNTHRLSMAVAPGDGFQLNIPKGLLGNTASRNGAPAVVARSSSGGPLPPWLTFDLATLSLTATKVPASALPTVVRLVGASGKLVEVTFQ